MDTSFYPSSPDIAPEFIGASIREHWRVENSLHWTLMWFIKKMYVEFMTGMRLNLWLSSGAWH
ncbi:hypothetical protein PSI22_11785 [Xenorhabdus sp. XENO-7]|uniref:Transposase n=1 Tax=Xenorhabdus aichiensis TaxID=3025874 RepID=A0ABT5M3P7_9GAMM|nr:hypothetical protein [Xenorhabdus aichiensis]MDC9622295.1 hypothetical protein [Xenorhabdus aichiensis]